MRGKLGRRVRCACLAVLFGSIWGGSTLGAGGVALQYFLQEIDTLGRPSSRAAGINSAGQVAATAIASNGATQIFVYSNGVSTPHGAPSVASYAEGINNNGDVIGWAFGIAPHDPKSFVNAGGQITILPLLRPMGSTHALSINDVGDITGFAESPNGRDHAFLYHAGTMQDLGVLHGGDADSSEGDGINNLGMIAGTTHINGFGNQPFVYANGLTTSFGQPGWFVTGINDDGEIVGSTSQTNHSDGFFFDGSTTHIISVPFDERCDALAVNTHGEVVGRLHVADGTDHAFIYTTSAGLVDLNTLVLQLPQNLLLNIALGINDSGQIAVNGTLDGNERAFLLTPVPEPATTSTALALAAAATVLHRRREDRNQPPAATCSRSLRQH